MLLILRHTISSLVPRQSRPLQNVNTTSVTTKILGHLCSVAARMRHGCGMDFFDVTSFRNRECIMSFCTVSALGVLKLNFAAQRDAMPRISISRHYGLWRESPMPWPRQTDPRIHPPPPRYQRSPSPTTATSRTTQAGGSSVPLVHVFGCGPRTTLRASRDNLRARTRTRTGPRRGKDFRPPRRAPPSCATGACTCPHRLPAPSLSSRRSFSFSKVGGTRQAGTVRSRVGLRCFSPDFSITPDGTLTTLNQDGPLAHYQV